MRWIQREIEDWVDDLVPQAVGQDEPNFDITPLGSFGIDTTSEAAMYLSLVSTPSPFFPSWG